MSSLENKLYFFQSIFAHIYIADQDIWLTMWKSKDHMKEWSVSKHSKLFSRKFYSIAYNNK